MIPFLCLIVFAIVGLAAWHLAHPGAAKEAGRYLFAFSAAGIVWVVARAAVFPT